MPGRRGAPWGSEEMRHGAGMFIMRMTSTMRSSTPIANNMVGAGMARTRIGGSWGHVPLQIVS